MQTGSLLAVAHLLVVEDDQETRTLLLRFFQENGYEASGARTGVEMWDVFGRVPIDLLLLDVMLPGISGLDLCREVRKRSTVPIIMLTARDSETDKVLGLELGADDYVPKPFSRIELLARIRAVLRRGRALGEAGGPPRGRTICFAGWRLDTGRRELQAPGGDTVDVSGAEYDLLIAFIENPQRILTRDRILEMSRTRIGDVFDRSVDVLVSRLRRKLETPQDMAGEGLIKTVRGAGYMFVPDVTRE